MHWYARYGAYHYERMDGVCNVPRRSIFLHLYGNLTHTYCTYRLVLYLYNLFLNISSVLGNRCHFHEFYSQNFEKSRMLLFYHSPTEYMAFVYRSPRQYVCTSMVARYAYRVRKAARPRRCIL